MSNKKLPLSSIESSQHKSLVDDIAQLIQQGQRRVAAEVNATVVLLYWTIGKRINDEILIDKRADYGNQIIDTVSIQLSLQFGKGYSRSGLFRMVRFAKLYPDNQIVATVSRQLSWTHVVLLCQMDEEIKRDFYLQMACIDHWGVRTLREKMGSMLFERTKNERKEGEEKPLGIILCASKDEEDVEYLELDQAGIHVVQYLTQLPSKELMEAKLHDAIVNAKQQHEMHLLNLDKP